MCKATSSISASTLSAEFLCQSFKQDQESRPLIRIEILNSKGFAILDTGAKSNIASSTLREIFLRNKLPYQIRSLLMTLADGNERLVEAHVFQDVPVTLEKNPINYFRIS